MRIAYVGHSYHRTTRSTAFLLEPLGRLGAVTLFWDESWSGGPGVDVAAILEGGFDLVLVFQVEEPAAALARLGHPNLTFVPMYDGCWQRPDRFWRAFLDAKVLCFSSTLHERLRRLGARARFVRYHPDPSSFPAVAHGPEPRGYFWQRTRDVRWSTIRPLLGDARFASFTLHRAMDPTGGPFEPPGDADVARFGVRFTDWIPGRVEALAALAGHDVYFAPRLREGIGHSFLEAMAMGMLVVAPDLPTMNEYLEHGRNGLLYAPGHPGPLDLSRRAELGAAARRTVEAGFARWRRSLAPLLDFIAAPARAVPVAAPLLAFDPEAGSATPDPSDLDAARDLAGRRPVARLLARAARLRARLGRGRR